MYFGGWARVTIDDDYDAYDDDDDDDDDDIHMCIYIYRNTV